MSNKKDKITKISDEEMNEIIDMVNAMYPKTENRDSSGEWDKKSPMTVFWDHTKVFASIDPNTGKNREAYIKVTEGLHDGFLEIILVTPANTLNLKLRPEYGQLEAYHDNYTAVGGESHQNHHSKAYLGYEDLVREQAEGFTSVLDECDDDACLCGNHDYYNQPALPDSMNAWSEGNDLFHHTHCDCSTCYCDADDSDIEDMFDDFEEEWNNLDMDSILDDNIFFSEENLEGLWGEKECEAFFNFLMENPPKKEEDTMCHCSNCNQGSAAVCHKTYNIKEEPLWAEGAVHVGSKIRLMAWPKDHHIIIHDIIDEDGWNYAVIFRNQNGVVQSGVLMKQHLHQWERA